MTLKAISLDYIGKNYTAGLTVKGSVYKNGTLVGGLNSLTLAALDGINQPGFYGLEFSGATQAASPYSAVIGDKLKIVVDAIDSGKSSKDEKEFVVTAESLDDIEAHLGSQDTAIAAIKTELDSVATDAGTAASKATTAVADLEDSSIGLAAIQSAISALDTKIGSIQNNTSSKFLVPQELVVPSTGGNDYEIEFLLFNTENHLVDADGISHGAVNISVADVAGVDKSAILAGYVSGPVKMTWVSTGCYKLGFTIPSTFALGELKFTASYDQNSIAKIDKAVSLCVADVQASGLALESTSQSILTDTDAIKSDLEDGTIGLSAIKTAVGGVKTVVDAIKLKTDLLADVDIGLSAASTLQTAIKSVVDANATKLDDIEGSGFSALTDSLAALSARIFTGGRLI